MGTAYPIRRAGAPVPTRHKQEEACPQRYDTEDFTYK